MSVNHKADPGELIQWVTPESRSSAASNSGLIRIGTQPRTADAWHHDSCRPRGVVTRDFSAIFDRLFDRLPVRISTSDLHHWILRKKIFHIRAYDFGVQFSFNSLLTGRSITGLLSRTPQLKSTSYPASDSTCMYIVFRLLSLFYSVCFSSHPLHWLLLLDAVTNKKINTKNYWKWKHCAWGGSGWLTLPEKIYRSQSTNQSAKLNERLPDLCFAICRFSQVRFITPSHLTHNLFLFPIVFGINLIHFFDGKNKIGLGRIWSFVLGFRSLVARLVPFERGGTKRAKRFLAMESVNSLQFSAPQWWPLREGRDGKCERRNEKCEFGKGKCKLIANGPYSPKGKMAAAYPLVV